MQPLWVSIFTIRISKCKGVPFDGRERTFSSIRMFAPRKLFKLFGIATLVVVVLIVVLVCAVYFPFSGGPWGACRQPSKKRWA